MEVAESRATAPGVLLLRRVITVLAAPVAIFLLTTCFYWKLVLSDQYTYLDSPDLVNQVMPWFQFQAGEWRAGRIPLWDPYQWGGQPLIGQAQPGVAYPPNWILFLSSLRNGWMRQAHLHWYFVLIHYLAALFCYLLARDLGRSRWASIIGACIFAFGGFVGTNTWPQMLNGAIWIPLVFLFLFRLMRNEKPLLSAVWSGFFLGVAWLSGHHQVPIFTSLAAGGFWIYHLLEPRRFDPGRIRLVAIFGLFAFLIGAAQMLPAYEYGKLAHRWIGLENPVDWRQKVPYNIHSQYSFPPATLFGMVLPGMHDHTKGFMGVGALALAALAVALAWRHSAVRLLTALGAGGLLLSLGGWVEFHGVLYAILPMVDKARSPNMAFVIVNFAVAALAAYGFDLLIHGTEHKVIRRIALVCCGFAAFIFGLTSALAFAGRNADERIVLTGFFALAFAAIFWARDRRSLEPGVAIGALLILIFAELGMVGTYEFPNRFDKNHQSRLARMALHGNIAQFLQSRPQPVRITVNEKQMEYNFGDWYGIEQMNGYLASLTSNLTVVPAHSPHIHRIFAVNYHVGREPSGPEQREVYSGADGFKVYANPDALQRVRTVHELRQLNDKEDFRDATAFASEDFFDKPPIVGDAPALEKCAGDRVRLVHGLPSRVRIHAVMACRGMVILADTAYPGWVATVDGKSAKIHEPYGVLRAVVVDKGPHTIEMTYRPRSVILGFILTLFGAIGAAGITFLHRRT